MTLNASFALRAVLLASVLAPTLSIAAEGAGFDEEILVVAPTPAGGSGLAADKLPFNVQAADAMPSSARRPPI